MQGCHTIKMQGNCPSTFSKIGVLPPPSLSENHRFCPARCHRQANHLCLLRVIWSFHTSVGYRFPVFKISPHPLIMSTPFKGGRHIVLLRLTSASVSALALASGLALRHPLLDFFWVHQNMIPAI